MSEKNMLRALFFFSSFSVIVITTVSEAISILIGWCFTYLVFEALFDNAVFQRFIPRPRSWRWRW